jgi:hypothetical protein
MKFLLNDMYLSAQGVAVNFLEWFYYESYQVILNFYYVRIMHVHVSTCIGCSSKNGVSFVKAVVSIRGVCSYLFLKNG